MEIEPTSDSDLVDNSAYLTDKRMVILKKDPRISAIRSLRKATLELKFELGRNIYEFMNDQQCSLFCLKTLLEPEEFSIVELFKARRYYLLVEIIRKIYGLPKDWFPPEYQFDRIRSVDLENEKQVRALLEKLQLKKEHFADSTQEKKRKNKEKDLEEVAEQLARLPMPGEETDLELGKEETVEVTPFLPSSQKDSNDRSSKKLAKEPTFPEQESDPSAPLEDINPSSSVPSASLKETSNSSLPLTNSVGSYRKMIQDFEASPLVPFQKWDGKGLWESIENPSALLKSLGKLVKPDIGWKQERPGRVVKDKLKRAARHLELLPLLLFLNDKCENLPWYELHLPHPIALSSGFCAFVTVFPKVIPSELIQILSESTEILYKKAPIEDSKTCRGKGKMYYLGVSPMNAWSEKTPYYVNESKEPFQEWRKHNELLLRWVREFVGVQYPTFTKTAEKLGFTSSPYFPFTSAEINYRHLVKAHRDKTDYRGGANVIIPFGKYSGGRLCLKELRLKLPLQPGDIAFVLGREVTHWVEPLELESDIRSSLILTSRLVKLLLSSKTPVVVDLKRNKQDSKNQQDQRNGNKVN